MTRKRSFALAGYVALAIPLLQGFGGGGGGAAVRSSALVPDADGCRIEAKVYTGDEPDSFFGGSCLAYVRFHLFSAAGNPIHHETLDPTVLDDLRLYPPEQHVSFDLRICRGQRVPPPDSPPVAQPADTAFLVPGADRCPEGTVFPAFWAEVHMQEPLQEVSCDELSRVDVEVGGC